MKTGILKAAVLPLPVQAVQRTSWFYKEIGIEYCYIGVSF